MYLYESLCWFFYTDDTLHLWPYRNTHSGHIRVKWLYMTFFTLALFELYAMYKHDPRNVKQSID